MHKKKAFTLIELLVVIAIIAILAAILFPVFAQAKRAAKAAAALSNTKQMALGVVMYTNDYDDEWPLAEAWGESNAVFGFGGVSSAPNGFLGFSPWSYTIFPYIKSAAIYTDPMAGGTDGYSPSNNITLEQWEAYNTAFGYNWTLLNGGFNNSTAGNNVYSSGFGYSNPVVQYSTATTALSRPSDMVMLTQSPLHTDPGYGDGFYCFWLSGCSTLDIVEGPYCNSGASNGCYDLSSYWGTDNGWSGLNPDTYPSLGFTEGGDTSGVASRDNGLSITAFTDGHSKAMSLGALAAGTTWSPTSTKSQVQLIDKNAYRWWQY